MDRKFHQLRPGQCFQWQGTTYEKVNPLLARDTASGAQRLIPRSTPVTPLPEGGPTPHETPPRQPAGTPALRQAFEDYHRSSLYWLEQLEGTEETRAQVRDALEQARQRFLSVLGE